MDIMVVRHSMSVSNQGGLISGAANDVALSEEGIRYAETVRDAYDWSRFDAVYASPLLRARTTANIITNQREDIVLDKRVEEMNFGDWEGQKAAPFEEKHPDAFDYEHMFNENYAKYAPNAESHSELIARVASFVADLKREHANDSVLVVCHGVTIRAFMTVLLGMPFSTVGMIDNLTLNEVYLNAEAEFAPRLYRFNERLA